MTNGFVTLRSKSTGKTGEYPERFLAFDDLELADPETASCVDCVVPEVSNDDLKYPESVVDEFNRPVEPEDEGYYDDDEEEDR